MEQHERFDIGRIQHKRLTYIGSELAELASKRVEVGSSRSVVTLKYLRLGRQKLHDSGDGTILQHGAERRGLAGIQGAGGMAARQQDGMECPAGHDRFGVVDRAPRKETESAQKGRGLWHATPIVEEKAD